MDYRIEERDAFDVVVKAKRVEAEEGNSTQIPAFWDEYFADGLAKNVIPSTGHKKMHFFFALSYSMCSEPGSLTVSAWDSTKTEVFERLARTWQGIEKHISIRNYFWVLPFFFMRWMQGIPHLCKKVIDLCPLVVIPTFPLTNRTPMTTF